MNAPVRRPAGVTAAAIVGMLGSLLTFLVAVMIFTSAFVPVTPPQPPGFAALAIGVGLFTAALAVLGLATSIALLQLRSWARTSVLVFSVVLVIMSAFGLLVALVMPIPSVPDTDPRLLGSARAVMTGIFALPLAVGAWWLVQFNTASVKDAFVAVAAGAGDVDAGLPLSVSITAWVSIAGGVLCVIPIIARMPLFVFGVNLEDWAAGVAYAFFGALSIYIGRGLLDLRERARLLCIAWYLFFTLHMLAVTLVAPVRERMLAAQRALQPGGEAVPMDATRLVYLSLGLSVVIAALAIAFLHRHRALFRRGTTS